MGGAGVKQMWVGLNVGGTELVIMTSRLKGCGQAKNGYRWEGILSLD